MKKPILCSLLAFLLLCFLAACVSEAPEPTPTPGTGDAITTATPTPDETTTESVEITSDGPTGTTAEITTAEVTTTEPQTTYEEVWVTDQNGYPYVLLSPTYPESETGDGTPIKVADTEMPWYITEWETSQVVAKQEISEEFDGYALKIPKVTETVTNGFRVKVESFQEYYRPGEMIQIRVTVENMSDEILDIWYSTYGKPMKNVYFAQMTARDYDVVFGEQKRVGWLLPQIFPKLSAMEIMTCDNPFYVYMTHIHQHYWDSQLLVYPEGTPEAELSSSTGKRKAVAGILTLEMTIYNDLEKTDVNGDYDLWINLFIIKGNDESGWHYRLPIPIEFVPVTWVKAES
jgi:hypothetical protein